MNELLANAHHEGVKAAHFLSSAPENADSPHNVSHAENFCPYKEPSFLRSYWQRGFLSVFYNDGFKLGVLGFTECPYTSYGNLDVINSWRNGCSDGLNQLGPHKPKKKILRKKIDWNRDGF